MHKAFEMREKQQHVQTHHDTAVETEIGRHAIILVHPRAGGLPACWTAILLGTVGDIETPDRRLATVRGHSSEGKGCAREIQHRGMKRYKGALARAG